MAKDDLDFVVHLGDYIYEGSHSSKPRGMDQVTPEIYTLDDYRNRYALYKLDSDLQAAHANFPWIVTFDDHEVDNNYAGDIPQDPQKQSKEDFLKRRVLPTKPIMNICRFAVPLCQMEATSKYIVVFPLVI